MSSDRVAVVVLAAGKGTRMQSRRQKILHAVGGKPMVQHLVDEARRIPGSLAPLLVVGVGSDGVQKLFGDSARYVIQAQQLGTGHAVQIAAGSLRGAAGQVLVTYADMPLLRAETMRRLVTRRAETNAAIVLLSVLGQPSSSFGRIVRDDDGHVVEILEVANARRRPDPQRWLDIREQNAGVYCFEADFLWQNIDDLPLRQARSGLEYYLTDMVEIAVRKGRRVDAVITDDPDECLGAGTRAEMVRVERAFRDRANHRWLNAGVTLVDPATTFIDPDVTIGQDSVIWPNSYLQGQTRVGEGCTIGPNSVLRNADIGDGCTIEQAMVENATIPDGTRVAPFAHVTGSYGRSSE